MSFTVANQAFIENLELIGGAASTADPEKYNLYSGLANLAEGLHGLEATLQDVQAMISNLSLR